MLNFENIDHFITYFLNNFVLIKESSQSRSSMSISNTNHPNEHDWVQKRNQAEQELLET